MNTIPPGYWCLPGLGWDGSVHTTHMHIREWHKKEFQWLIQVDGAVQVHTHQIVKPKAHIVSDNRIEDNVQLLIRE
jgi:hypothetical protein